MAHDDAPTVNSYAASLRAAPVFRLGDRLPLAAPLSILIDVANACNFRCIQCPTGDTELLASVGRIKALMPIDLFCKIIDDIVALPAPVPVIHLYKDGEPLLNKRLPEMVAYAKQRSAAGRIETTTNGSLLTPARFEPLLAAGLDGIRISVYGTDDQQYGRVTRTNVRFDDIAANVAALFQARNAGHYTTTIHCKIIDAGLSAENKERFLATFAPISDSVNFDGIMGWTGTDRDFTLGTNPDIGISGAVAKPNRRICSEPFTRLAINVDGTVSPCCVDWAMRGIVGDTRGMSVGEIWCGIELARFRRLHLLDRREEIPICRGCHYIKGLPSYADLDDDAEHLLPLFCGGEMRCA